MATKQEEYRGPSKAGQAFATGAAWGVVGTVAGTGIGAVGVVKGIFNTMGSKAGAAAPKIRGRYLIAAGVILGPAAWLVGTVRGWLKASGAKQQFDGLVSERNEAQSRIEGLEKKLENTTAQAEGLQTQVEGLSQEITAHRKSFAELHAKHEQSASHAAKHESRAEHGSQVAAALNDKEKAATAEHTV